MSTASDFDGRAFARELTRAPGVYRMLGDDREVLYVGKAANLQNRVGSYFVNTKRDLRIARMVEQIQGIDITITRTEGEALVLEAELIKAHRPRYNVLLRDDKSYPWIHLSEHDYPRLAFHRGPRRRAGHYYGPYPSAYAVRANLKEMQKLFKVRQCEDTYFANRSRPCLQYQIKRCSAPCVAAITPERYERDVRQAKLFLANRSQRVIDEIKTEMDEASAALAFERAAELRDRIATLQRLKAESSVTGAGGELDCIAIASQAGVACVYVFTFRDGRTLGSRAYFPQHTDHLDNADVLRGFLLQYYDQRPPPRDVLVSTPIPDQSLLTSFLSERRGAQVKIIAKPRGERASALRLAAQNAQLSLDQKLAGSAGMLARRQSLAELLGMDEPPERLECFDISHTRGEKAVASCVVFDANGPKRQDYRRFNIVGIEPGDDYAAIRQAVERRYRRLKQGEAPLPDVLFIDGGKGQLSQAEDVLEQLQVQGVIAVGVGKGPERKSGEEQLIFGRPRQTLRPGIDSPGLHLVQAIRDEAHRFALVGHRARRTKARTQSPLESIPGIGAKRRREIIKHFGGLQGVVKASREDLSRVPGLSQSLAERVYRHLHLNDA